MSSFCISTQCEDWLMEPEDLVYLRARSMSQIKTQPKQQQSTEKDTIIVRGLRKETDEDSELSISNQTKNILEQEEVFLTRYCRQIQRYFGEETKDEKSTGKKRIIGAVSHWRVSATAIVYFRRFYLNNNLVAFDPRVIMLTCVFLAGKVEESPARMQSLLSVYPECDKDTITSHELILIEGLNYHLKIFHSRNVMHTVITDFRRWSEELQKEEIKQQQQRIENQKTLPKLITESPNNSKDDSSPTNKEVQSSKRIRTNDSSSSSIDLTAVASSSSSSSSSSSVSIEQKASTSVVSSHSTTPLNSSRMNVEKDDIKVTANTSSSSSITTVVVESSEMRKQWRELAESYVESFQNSIATLCYTPAEVAICSLKLSLQDPSLSSLYPHIAEKYEEYLRERYGVAVASELNRILPNLQDLLVYETEAEKDDDSFNAVKLRLNITV